MACLNDEINKKYPMPTSYARKLLLPFPTTYLTECGFSVINDLLSIREIVLISLKEVI